MGSKIERKGSCIILVKYKTSDKCLVDVVHLCVGKGAVPIYRLSNNQLFLFEKIWEVIAFTVYKCRMLAQNDQIVRHASPSNKYTCNTMPSLCARLSNIFKGFIQRPFLIIQCSRHLHGLV